MCSAKDHTDFNKIPLSITDDWGLCSAGTFVDDKTSMRQTEFLVSVIREWCLMMCFLLCAFLLAFSTATLASAVTECH